MLHYKNQKDEGNPLGVWYESIMLVPIVNFPPVSFDDVKLNILEGNCEKQIAGSSAYSPSVSIFCNWKIAVRCAHK